MCYTRRAPPRFHASLRPFNKAGSSAHCRVMNTGNTFDVPHFETRNVADTSQAVTTAARGRARTREIILARVEAEKLCAPPVYRSLFLFLIYPSNSLILTVNWPTVSDGNRLVRKRRNSQRESLRFHVCRFSSSVRCQSPLIQRKIHVTDVT